MVYHPSQKILDKYADVLINCALNSGKGVRKGEVVFLQVPECAKPFLISLQRVVLKAGAIPLLQYLPDNISREYYMLANKKQISHFPAHYIKGRVDDVDHYVFVEAETNKHELEGINPGKIMLRQKAFKPYKDWRDEKENKGKMTWTIALYGTPEMAKEVKMSEKAYWGQIIKACYLDVKYPVRKWREILREVDRLKNKLNKLKIEKLHIKSKGTDLIVGLGENRLWMGGTGRNIPSFEVFISPDWRKTEGKIRFNQPLYRYGNLIKDVYFEFKNGRIVKVKASKGEKILKEMIAQKNADKIGEFSLTDSRLSRIIKFMGETLFDENVGGRYGNTHSAV